MLGFLGGGWFEIQTSFPNSIQFKIFNIKKNLTLQLRKSTLEVTEHDVKTLAIKLCASIPVMIKMPWKIVPTNISRSKSMASVLYP